MQNRNLRYKKLKRILESFGLEVGDSGGQGGKGSEAKIRDPRTRPPRIHVIKKHDRNPEIPKQVIYHVRRKFQLDPEHGISDDNFYSRA